MVENEQSKFITITNKESDSEVLFDFVYFHKVIHKKMWISLWKPANPQGQVCEVENQRKMDRLKMA